MFAYSKGESESSHHEKPNFTAIKFTGEQMGNDEKICKILNILYYYYYLKLKQIPNFGAANFDLGKNGED